MAKNSTEGIAPEKKSSRVELALPTRIVRGRKVVAVYREQKLSFYGDNPLIAALPAIHDTNTVIKRLTIYRRDLEILDLESLIPEERLHLVAEAENFFQPVDHHTDLERRFSRMIRQGYMGRNPVVWGYWKYKLDRIEEMMKNIREGAERTAGGTKQETAGEESVEAFTVEGTPYTEAGDELEDFSFSESAYDEESDFDKRLRRLCSTSIGFAILGLSGMGKSLAVEQILKEFYDQVIFHRVWNDVPFPHVQLVWLKLDCPSNGSVKSLCLHFFIAVDDILGTNYYARYAKNGRASAEEMMPFVANVAMTHSLGALILDEIQNLAAAASGGAERLVNFLVELVNTIGVPVVLVGTNQAYHDGIFSKFREARRASGQGDKYWDRMRLYAKGSENDEEEKRPLDPMWNLFTQALWDLQFLKRIPPAEFSEPNAAEESSEPNAASEYEREEFSVDRTLSKALYDVSQGITFFAVKAFFLAQIRAIEVARLSWTVSVDETRPPEELTEDLFVSVLDILRLASPILDALRAPHENQTLIEQSADIKPIHLSYYADQAIARLQEAALARARSEARGETGGTATESRHGNEAAAQEAAEHAAVTDGKQEPMPGVGQPAETRPASGTPHESNSSAPADKRTKGTRSHTAKDRQSKPNRKAHGTGRGSSNGNSPLAQIVAAGQEQGLTGHQALVDAGIMYTEAAADEQAE